MRYPIRHLREYRSISLVVFAAAVLLLTLSARAQAQAANAADPAAAMAQVESTASAEAALVSEEPAVAEPAPAPEPPDAVPQPVETATEAVGDEEATDAATQVAHVADPPPTPTPTPPGSVSKASADSSGIDQTIARATQAGQATTEAAAGTVASTSGHLPRPDRALPELSKTVQRDAMNTTGHAENVLKKSVDRIDLSGIEDLRMAAVTSLEGRREALPFAAAGQEPRFPTALPPTSPAGSPDKRAIPFHERAIPFDRLLELQVSRPGGIRLLPLAEPRIPGFFGMSAAAHGGDRRSSSPVMDAYADDTERGTRESAPFENPAPPDDLPQMGASPSGATFFFPIAALLALLALVAPAIDRRRRRTVACSPPVPFVCALERPG